MNLVLDMKPMEEKLRLEARNFVGDKSDLPIHPQSALRILQMTTGLELDCLSKRANLLQALGVVRKFLARERKRSKMQRQDYSLNRHMALHQINKYLLNLR